MTKYLRKKKLIKPALQLKLAGIFMATALVVVSIQAYTLHSTTMSLSTYLPSDQDLFVELWPYLFLRNELLAGLLILVAMFGVGVAVTHKLAGPLHRFEIYLRALQAGEETGPCRLRSGDELQDFCKLLNDATAPLRERSKNEAAPEPVRETREAA